MDGGLEREAVEKRGEDGRGGRMGEREVDTERKERQEKEGVEKRHKILYCGGGEGST